MFRIFSPLLFFCFFTLYCQGSKTVYLGLNPVYTQSKLSPKASTITVENVGPINGNSEEQYIRGSLSGLSPSYQKINFEILLGYRNQINPLLFDVALSAQTGQKKTRIGSLTGILTADIQGGLPVGADTENVSLFVKKGFSYGFSLRGGINISENTALFLGVKTSLQMGRVYALGSFVDDNITETYTVNQSSSYTTINFTPEIMVETSLRDQITATATLGYRNAVRKKVSGRINGIEIGDRGLVIKAGVRYYF